ncbi:TonB family protein [Marinobacter sp.]|uniref:TonB family protein n=1 Tax=Marinobacter sp. TaxID=50741 RepID=UPI001A102F92|nr:TonB family protein [Marinobacter sp.]MBE0486011.1 TonB family protein [Marinobacter sp.]
MIRTITNLPSEQDSYLILLATHLAETLEHQRVPAISRLKETVTMQFELRILPKGALTRARVVQSTGLPGIDEAAYRAALAASPYPEPEEEKTDRFEVTLVFTSKRQ